MELAEKQVDTLKQVESGKGGDLHEIIEEEDRQIRYS